MAESNFSPYGHPKGHTDANGNWVRNSEQPVDSDDAAANAVSLRLAIGFATPDAAALFTVPAGKSLLIEDAFWEVTQAWTGGSSSAIGVSSNTAPATAKGALLGGASGDVAATLATLGDVKGTIGSAMAADVLLVAGALIRFDRITSAFTAGAGFVRIIGRYV